MPNYKFTVKITKNNKDAFLRALPGAIQKSLNEIGDAIVQHTQEKVPVDTGALRDSYMKDVNEAAQTVRVGSPLDYSAYVELGTGPNYETPPDWVTNNAQRGYHLDDLGGIWAMMESGTRAGSSAHGRTFGLRSRTMLPNTNAFSRQTLKTHR